MTLLSSLCLTVLSGATDGPQTLPTDSTPPPPRHIPHVEISAQRTPDGDACLEPLSTTHISARAIEAAHSPSLLPLLSSAVPSLFVTSRGVMGYGLSTGAAGTLKMRGIGGEKSTGVLVLLDGEPMVQGLMGHTLADTYQSLGAQAVEVVRGPASVRFGADALGGVINIKTRPAEPAATKESSSSMELHAACGTHRTLSSGLSLRHTTRNGFCMEAAASYDRTAGHRQGLDFEQGSALLKAGSHMGQHWKWQWQGYATRFEAGNPGTTDTPLTGSRAQALRGTTSLSLRHNFAACDGSVRLYGSGGIHHIDDGYSAVEVPPDYQFRAEDFICGASIDETLRPCSSLTLFVGGEVRRQGGKAWNEPTDGHGATHHGGTPRTYIADTAVWSVGAYLCAGWELSPKWTADGGVRCAYDAACGTEWVPQGGITFRPNRQTRLKALVSRGFRAPSLRELYMWQAANAELQAESVWNYEASLERWWLGHRLRTQCTLYDMRASNLIETTYTDGRPRNVNIGRQRNRGMEVEAEWQVSRRWNYATNYSYLHTDRPVTAAPRHKWHQELSFTTERWRVAPALLYVGRLYTATDPEVMTSYFVLNLNAECRLTSHLVVYARGENLTGRSYEVIDGYPMPRATVLSGVKWRL